MNYQNFDISDKKYCVAFCPRIVESSDEIKGFFSYYPDGFHIQLVRNPLGWWASEKRYGSSSKNIEDYLEKRWVASLKIGLQVADLYPNRYLLVGYDEIIKNPERSLRKICEKLGLSFDYKLLVPTINNMPTISNTSFGNGKSGIDGSTLDRWKKYLADYEIEKIENKTAQLYEEGISKCINPAYS